MLNLTETETLAAYMKPPSRYGGAGGAGGMDDSGGGPAKGFVVRDAPWNTSGNKVFNIVQRLNTYLIMFDVLRASFLPRCYCPHVVIDGNALFLIR